MLTEPCIKEKIGAHLSYPIAFAELRALLNPTPDELTLEVWFRAWKAPRKNEVRERYTVFETRYSPPPFGPTWQLFVSPIPRPLRSMVHSLLPAAISSIRSWLLASHTPVWYSFGHAIFIDFVSESHRLVTRKFDKA